MISILIQQIPAHSALLLLITSFSIFSAGKLTIWVTVQGISTGYLEVGS